MTLALGGDMSVIVAVEVEELIRYVNFKGCDRCKGDRGHEYATCRCTCHHRPDTKRVAVLMCGCRKHFGFMPTIGEPSRCWGTHPVKESTNAA